MKNINQLINTKKRKGEKKNNMKRKKRMNFEANLFFYM